MIAEIRIAVQLGIGVLLLLSSVGKWRNPMGFARGVVDYDILPAWLAYPLGLLLVPLESWLGVAHLTGWLISRAVTVALVTLGTFALAVGLNLKRGHVLPCYCFGGRRGETISLQTLARLCLLLTGEAFLFLTPGFRAPDTLVLRQTKSLPDLGLALFWAGVLLLGGMWLLSLADFVDVLRPCSRCGRTLASD